LLFLAAQRLLGLLTAGEVEIDSSDASRHSFRASEDISAGQQPSHPAVIPPLNAEFRGGSRLPEGVELILRESLRAILGQNTLNALLQSVEAEQFV
jgi:hypothetical protein